jgi:diadenosine tetraphosphate (Ap4A) HIT family hydrolase
MSYTYDKTNVFAKILRSELPCKKVYEDKYAVAFHDLNPEASVHILVIPKGEFVSFSHFMNDADSEFIVNFFKAVQAVVTILEVEKSGYRIVSNCGEGAGQSVMHFHVHIVSGNELKYKILN